MPADRPTLRWPGIAVVVVVAAQLAGAASAQALTHRPNLVVSSVSRPPASRRPGQSFSLSETTGNTGTAAAATSVTRYYLSIDSRKGRSDIRLSPGHSVPKLGAGTSSSKMLTASIPVSAPTGIYHLVACADDTRVVTESSESDNCRAATTTIKLVPHPLTVTRTLEQGHAASKIISHFGGSIGTTAADGTQFALSFPSQALLSPERITLTPIASIAGSPVTSPVIAGVDIEPSGLGLQKAATLTITPTSPVPLSDQHGFSFEGTGSEFHRYPLGLDTSHIVFTLTHFSGEAVQSATPGQLAAVQADTPSGAVSQLESTLAGPEESFRAGDSTQGQMDAAARAALLQAFAEVDRTLHEAETSDEKIDSAVIVERGWENQLIVLGSQSDFPTQLQEIADEMVKIGVNAFKRAHNRCVQHDNPRTQLIRMMKAVRQLDERGANPAAVLGADYWDQMKACVTYEVTFDGTSAGDSQTPPNGQTFNFATTNAHVHVTNLVLHLNDSLQHQAGEFIGGGPQQPLAVSDLQSTSKYATCNDGLIWSAGPVNSGSNIQARFLPELNTGVPNPTTTRGIVVVSPNDSEDATNQCGGDSLSGVLSLFRDGFSSAWVLKGDGNFGPGGIDYAGTTFTKHVTGDDGTTTWTVDFSVKVSLVT